VNYVLGVAFGIIGIGIIRNRRAIAERAWQGVSLGQVESDGGRRFQLIALTVIGSLLLVAAVVMFVPQ
jgi:hypothetical protein